MTAARLRVTVDHDRCVGVAMCQFHAPGAFHLDENGQSVFDPDGDWEVGDVEDAIDACPMAALREVDQAEPTTS